ncbi:MAG: SDR family NAD(P)-dependent oxidoreductase [Lachnospiraceae bacterium]|nr:SDR family NAD(P)-dependent oxidoreductase [Lachnospiraceae bacterium]
MKIAIVTGASSGMGRDFVRYISALNPTLDEIWVVARRKERMEALAKHTHAALRVLPLDLSKPESIDEIRDLLFETQPSIKYLVNCAGYGKIGNFKELSYMDNIGMIDVNCRALTAMTFVCLPYLKQKSKIINLASSAAFMPQATFAVYAASKAYVLSFSRALAHELKNRQIGVTAVCPGPVKTEFFDIAETNGNVLEIKKYFMADSKEVVKQALRDTLKNKEKSVYGLPMKAFEVLAKVVPHKVIMNIMDLMYD